MINYLRILLFFLFIFPFLVLLAEIKQKYQENLKSRKNHPSYHLKYTMSDPDVFNDITDLITNAAERTLSKADREKVLKNLSLVGTKSLLSVGCFHGALCQTFLWYCTKR